MEGMEQEMKTIYKYALQKQGKNIVEMPRNARILHVGTQSDHPYVWALIDTDNPMEDRYFWIIGTGYEMPVTLSDLRHIGTFITRDGSFVGHVFGEGHGS
jgi:hypothetical protein